LSIAIVSLQRRRRKSNTKFPLSLPSTSWSRHFSVAGLVETFRVVRDSRQGMPRPERVI
jgi:hypothetical protein